MNKSRGLKKITASAFPIVGIGASAGGLDAFSQLLRGLPPTTGMAFVLIQHLDPNHPSLLRNALMKTTSMPVLEITDGMQLEPDHVYVTPSNSDVGLLRNKFSLFPREKNKRGAHLSIDFFFRILAADRGSHAIGVVLSGMANDGTEGLRAIKGENGVTLVQHPDTAKFNGMPRSAMAADVVDYCLPIPELVKELVRLAEHPYVSGSIKEPLSEPKDQPEIQKIFVLLKTHTGIDFSEYKPSTINRRLARRMALLKIDTLSEYVKFLQHRPEEVKALKTDLLIHVTSFFRDPDVFKKLKTIVLPRIIKNKTPGAPIRVWVTGCSTGEEVYSIGITLLEFFEGQPVSHPIQVFGSDLCEKVIERARKGVYAESGTRGLSSEQLNKYFIKTDQGYQINKSVRELCVFVRHDLAKDPPFSKLDLVTCRNVLIYFEPVLQKRIISTFHYCLNQPGFLLLGRTESISSHHQFFSVADKNNKIFSREGITSQLSFVTMQNTRGEKQAFQATLHLPANRPSFDLTKQFDGTLLSHYAPAGVAINNRMEILQYRGKTSAYLEPPPGQPQLHLLKMVREGLFAPVKMAITEAKRKMVVIRKEGLKFKRDGAPQMCNVVVIPMKTTPVIKEPIFLVLFEEVVVAKTKKTRGKGVLGKLGKLTEIKSSQLVESLSHELRSTQDYLNSINEDHQRSNDTLNAANEELISGNEELQSMNEELETAKEELQSTNEELSTVNDELQNRNQEAVQANDDLINLLNSVEIPILILDRERRIRRYTPKARKIMNLLPTDIGRQIDDIRPNIIIDDIDLHVQEVIDTATTMEMEVQNREDKWFRLQIRPYKTSDNKISGAVLSLININALKRAIDDAQWMRDYLTSIIESAQFPLIVLNDKLQVSSINRAFSEYFGVSDAEAEYKDFFALELGRWDQGILKASLDETVKNKASFQNSDIVFEDVTHGRRIMAVSARSSYFHDGQPMILLSMQDITQRKMAEVQLAGEKDKLETIFRESPAAMALWRGKNFVFEKVNPEYQALFAGRELLGRPYIDALPELRDLHFYGQMQKVLETGETYVGHEVKATLAGKTTKSPQDRYFDFTYVRVEDPNQNTDGVYIHSVEVTDRVIARNLLEDSKNYLQLAVEDLEQERELRERFVATLTHDLRTPITAVKLTAQLLGARVVSPDDIQKMAKRINSSIERADKMIRDLLDANRLKSGQGVPIVVRECDAMVIIDGVVGSLQVIYGPRFRVQGSMDAVSGYWDGESIERVIENLACNAVKYGAPGTPITISCITDSNNVTFKIHNVGNPIPLEDQKNLFTPYRRTDTAIKSGQRGWGIGLTLVKGIIDAHKGTIHVESSLENGTTFYVMIPIDGRVSPERAVDF